MDIKPKKFDTLEITQKMELINQFGVFVANRIYYNHKVNLYSLNQFFVEVHLTIEGNEIDQILSVNDSYVFNAYHKRINLKYD